MLYAIIIKDNGGVIINTKFIQKVLLLLAFFSLFACITTFKETYAKYVSNIDESANIKIARWRILLNGDDIRNSSTTQSVITPVFTDNDNIKDNVIAPHAEGYFDLIIDGTDADVSFKYEIDIKVNENSSVKDLIVTGYSVNNSDIIEEVSGTISNTVLLTKENKATTIRVYIKWDDSNESSMDNKEDTVATLSNVDAKLDVTLKFTQIAQ